MHEPARARCRGGSVSRKSVAAVSDRRHGDETVFRVTNFRYHANPPSERVSFRRQCNDSTFQRITTAKLNALLANAFGV